MATLDYKKRLANLQNRKFDNVLNESATTKLFSQNDVPENIKYMVDSMSPLENKYNTRTIEAANRVQKHLENNLQMHFSRAYRTQGSVVTKTNIRTHSDFDLLTVIDKYFYLPSTVPNDNPYTATDPNTDIRELRDQSASILKKIYQEVDDSGEKCISIFNKDLNRKVDVVFAFWFNSEKYISSGDEYYRGIRIGKSHARTDFPFAHAHQVNLKGDNTNDGSRRAIRLLKNLGADSETEIKLLRGFHYTTLVNPISGTEIFYQPGNDIEIAKSVSTQLGRLITEPEYRKQLKSPNGTEQPLADDGMVPEFQKIKEDLDTLIVDSSKELSSPRLRNILLHF